MAIDPEVIGSHIDSPLGHSFSELVDFSASRCVQFNAQTLADPGLRKVLLARFYGLKMSFCFLQESRSKFKGIRVCGDFVLASSGACNGYAKYG
jgi:hypothetical protein